MHNLFLEDGDLLESVEIMSLLNEEVITETTISGLKVTKENLQDEKFVKDLIKKIKDYKVDKKDPNEVQKFFNLLFGILMIIMTMTIVLIPVVLLISVITLRIADHAHIKSQKELQKLDDCLEKTIKKLEKQKQKAKNKEEYDDAIAKLKSNRELIYNRSKVLSVVDIIDSSKYDDIGRIKIGNTMIETIVGDIVKNQNIAHLDNKLKQLKSLIDTWDSNKFDIRSIYHIEQLAHHNIDNQKFIKLIESNPAKGRGGELFDGWDDGFTNNEYRKYDKIVNKTLTHLYQTDSSQITYILYCHEDKCCYAVNFGWLTLDTITISQLLQASKQAYTDLEKLIKEYDKK